MDIDTININDIQIPILITYYYDINKQLKTIYTLINYKELNNDNINYCIKDLWLRFFYELFLNITNIKDTKFIIFMHNLGSFDGGFLYKGLMLIDDIFHYKNISTIIDKQNQFIQITAKNKQFKFIWKDSYRIFNISLNEYCQTFDVQGKINPYKKEYNNISLFENQILLDEFIQYAIQDSIALLNAMKKAQNIYLQEYNIDIASK